MMPRQPASIDALVPGLDTSAQQFINHLLNAYDMGTKIFQTSAPHHEDWVILFVLLDNDAANRATVTKNIVEITGRAYGTVRASLKRFEELGYITLQQKIGRSELYVPKPKLKEAVNAVSRSFQTSR